MTPASLQKSACVGLLLLTLLGTWPRPGAAQSFPAEGQPFLQLFTPRDYHASLVCWNAVQDTRGILYVGNRFVVLEYDGVTWRQIPITEDGFVYGLAYDAATDTVFVSCDRNLGYLKALPGGGRTFVSLLPQLPPDARDVGQVRRVFATPQGVFFVGLGGVMRWRDGKFTIWKPAPTGDRLYSGWVDGSFYVQNPQVGLLRLENEVFVPASMDPIFHRVEAGSMVDGPDGSMVIGTFLDGLFTLRGGVVTPWTGQANEFCKAKQISRILRLRDGSLAVATGKGGVILFDKDDQFRTRVDEAGGLPTGYVYSLFEDEEKGLWIGTQAGVARAEVHSALSLLRHGAGSASLYGEILTRFRGSEYLPALTGIYRVMPADPAQVVGAHVERLPQSEGTFFDLCGVEDGLLAAASTGVWLIDPGGQATSVVATNGTVLSLSRSRRHPDRFYLGESGGAQAVRFDAPTHRWIDEGVAAKLGTADAISTILSTEQDELWMGTHVSGMFRARFPVDGGSPAVTDFFKQPGPLQGEARTDLITNGTGAWIVNAIHGLYRFDEQTQNFVRASEYDTPSISRAYEFDNVTASNDAALWPVMHAAGDPNGERVFGRLTPGEKGQAAIFRRFPHKIAEAVGLIGAILPETDPTGKTVSVLITGDKNIARLNLAQWDALSPRAFSARIRRAVAIGGTGPIGRPSPILDKALSYDSNSVHFEFAGNTLGFGASLRFQTRLANLGAERWSDFTERNSVDYLSLPEGSYTFEVRALDADGRLSSMAALPFRVLPPRHRTLWAYFVYGTALVAGVAGSLRWRGRQLRRRNLALEALIDARTSELRIREAELVRARDDAESANRAKSAFLANMSHELRTPLNAILGYSQILLKNATLSPRSREQVAVVGQSGSHLLAMINEVLDLSKIEAGKLTLAPSEFSLHQLLEDVCAAFRPRLAEKGLEFRFEPVPGLPSTVHTDLNRLRQVLFNLMSNAVKFAQRGSVHLKVAPLAGNSAGKVRFEVADTGSGIAAKELHDIFLAFHQVGDAKLAAQGTGLGLAISQRLVGLMGGQIQVESTPGQGSRFWFDLPLVHTVSPAALPATAKPGEVHGTVTGYLGRARRLLVVDDQAENRRILSDLLQPLGFEIEEAASGPECLARCALGVPDALLLDLRLGQPDGFEVARTLRQRLAGEPLAIIAVSASVFESDRQRAIDAGCDDFLPKPFQEAQLVAVLGRALDLQWIFDADALPAPTGDAFAHEARTTPPPEEIDALLELSLRGDIVGIRKRLDALRTTGRCPVFVRGLEPLVASFQMDQLHRRLLKFKEHGGH